jgi:hypothetical protein
MFPLPEILNMLLGLGTWGMGSPVEIEFAVNLSVPQDKLKEFAMLQMRPLVISRELDELKVDFKPDELICQSSQVLGNGATDGIYDIIMVDKINMTEEKVEQLQWRLQNLIKNY